MINGDGIKLSEIPEITNKGTIVLYQQGGGLAAGFALRTPYM